METNQAMATGGPPQRGARCVLVVDDNRDAAASLAVMLELDQHRTHLAHSGPEAMEAVASFHPDAVLLDLGLPGLDGYEVAGRIRARPDGAGLLLVALTGWGGEEHRQKALAAGFDAYMVKPANLAALARLLKKDPSHDPCTDRR
jgi:CheY-like chemotaxis protein